MLNYEEAATLAAEWQHNTSGIIVGEIWPVPSGLFVLDWSCHCYDWRHGAAWVWTPQEAVAVTRWHREHHQRFLHSGQYHSFDYPDWFKTHDDYS